LPQASGAPGQGRARDRMSAMLRNMRARLALLARKIRIPLLGWRLPLWLLLLIVMPLLLVGGGAGVIYTNQPIFCTSCHEMDLHYDTWSRSSHRGVSCEQCHVMPGMANMLRSKINAIRLVRRHAAGDVTTTAIQGHVPDQNCKRCHPQTPELVTYHNLKITHKAHWKMGIKCTFCHDRVVHGPKWLYTGLTSENKKVATFITTAYTYTPTMERCYTCHDGKRAPNTCSTCHITLATHQPSAFNPAWVQAHREEAQRKNGEDCALCHQNYFCQNCHRSTNPHPGNWIAQHPKQAQTAPDSCPKCHLAPVEKLPTDIKQMAFCRDCHSLRREHKQANWQDLHGKESLSNPASCQRCHTASWCNDCHSITRPHPADWLAHHAAESNRAPQSCKVCHTEQFCSGCHQKKQSAPPSHSYDWISRHAQPARQRGAACNTCHKPDFCQACHSRRPPASHQKLWLESHGIVSRSGDESCRLCHKQSFCDRCHGMTMPHAKDWIVKHRETTTREREKCAKCHKADGCSACHKGALPASHTSAGWISQHGSQARQLQAQCEVCHRKLFCDSCHGLDMPHPKDWRTKGHTQAAKTNGDACLRCHQASYCLKCHGLPIPHPEGWVQDHGKQALSNSDTCAKCHRTGHNDCAVCHAALAPSSHNSADWKTTHAVTGAEHMSLCVLCHGNDACNSCHAARAKSTKK
jgi:nitrate/TMAO reductase-like tetraheme cytochrome c subunit